MSTLVTFDIDATLLLAGNGGVAHRDAFRSILIDKFGIDQDPGEYLNVSFAGCSDIWIVTSLLKKAESESCPSKEDLDIMVDCAEEHFISNFKDEINVLPGVFNLLEKLSEMPNVYTSICSGNLPRIGWKKLEVGNLSKYFNKDAAGWGLHIDRVDILKDAIKNSEKVYNTKFTKVIHIGDAHQDVKAAQDNGNIAIAVKTGHHDNFKPPVFVCQTLEEGFESIIDIIKKGSI